MAFNEFARFDETWRTSPMKKRLVNFVMPRGGINRVKRPNKKDVFSLPAWTPEQAESIDVLCSQLRSGIRYMLKARHADRQLPKVPSKYKSKRKANKSLWQNHIPALSDRGLNRAVWFRSVSLHAERIYSGYRGRNRKEMPRPAVRPNINALPAEYDAIVDLTPDKQDGTLRINLGGLGCTVELPYYIPRNMMEKKLLLAGQRSVSGNLLVGDHSIVLAAVVDVYFEWLYQALDPLAWDCNRTREYWLVFSEPMDFLGGERIMPMPADVAALLDEIAPLQEEAEHVNASKRRGINKKVDKLQAALKGRIDEIAAVIIDECKKKQMLVCIDGAAPKGSYGQDVLKASCVTKCENGAVPFVKVAAPFTTRQCGKCGSIAEKLSAHEISCENCGSEFSHGNASGNIARGGWITWKKGYRAWQSEIAKCKKEADRKDKKEVPF